MVPQARVPSAGPANNLVVPDQSWRAAGGNPRRRRPGANRSTGETAVEKIDGIDLGEMIKAAKEESLQAQRVKVVGILRNLYDQQAAAKQAVSRMEHELSQARKKLEGLNEQVAKVEKGDWAPLREPEKKNPEKRDPKGDD